MYTTASSFISYPCTTSELVAALPYPSILILNVDSLSTSITDLPCSYGILTVHKRTLNRIQIIFNRSYEGQVNGNNLYFGNYNSLSKTVTWNKIFTNYSGCQVPIENGGTGATTASAAISNLHGVEATTSEITYYISPSGSNSNSGTSSSSPFKTLAYALSKLPKFLKHDVTINVAQGTYSESEVLIAGFVGEGTLSIVGTAAANAVGAENYIFSNGIKINKNQGRVELHGIGSSNGFRVFNSPDVVFYYCHAYSPSLVSDRAGFFSTHSKVFTISCRATNIQNGFHSYQGGDLTAMCGVCTNCSYPWCSGEGAVLYVYGASSSGFTSAHNYSSAGVIVGSYGGTLGI